MEKAKRIEGCVGRLRYLQGQYDQTDEALFTILVYDGFQEDEIDSAFEIVAGTKNE